MKSRLSLTPRFTIAFIYLSVASFWILFSDTTLSILVGNGELYTRIQSIKGLAFVVASGLVIYYLIERQFASLSAAELALRQSEERFRVALKDSPIAVFNHDQSLRYTWIYNPKLGLSADEILGRTDFELLPDDTGKTLMAIKRKVIETGVGTRQEVVISGGFSPIYYDLIVEPLLDSAAKIIGVTCATIDITELKHAQNALTRSEERYRLVAKAANEVIWSWEKSTDIQEWNEGLSNLFGYDLKEHQITSGQWWYDHVHPEDLDAVIQKLAVIEQRGAETGLLEYRFRRVDGAYADVIDRIYLVYDTQGQAVKMVGAMEDVTAKRAAEAEIRRLNSELEQRVIRRTAQLEAVNHELEAFSYSVSHDLRAPLRAIDGFSRILLEDYEAQIDPEGRRYLNLVRTNAQQMGQLIDDLLTFSRLSRQAVKRATTRMSDIAQTTFDELLDGRSVTFKLADMPFAQADHALIKQVYANLIGNALKFTGTRVNPIIEVGSVVLDYETAYYVKDNGVGFDSRYTHKLFNVFQRLHRVDEFEGTGVGLAIVQRIITRHGGRVWAEGKLNEGAAFYFTLPEHTDEVAIADE